MRSAIVAMLMAGAFAAPSAHRAHMRIHQEREDAVVVETAIAYTTVTAGGAAPTVAPAAPPAPEAKVVTAAAPAPAASSAAAPAPAPPASYAPPAPVQASAPASSVAAPAPSASSSGSNTAGLNDYAKSALDAHNLHRANHSAPALTYDNGLASAAMTLAQRCSWPEGGSPHDVTIDAGSLGQYGQNAACGESDIAKTITGEWYNNEVMTYQWYGSNPPSDESTFSKIGHFTQIVWKGSSKVGCATASCPNGVGNPLYPSVKTMTICNYGGPGNYAGQYASNVMAPLGHANSAANVGKVDNV